MSELEKLTYRAGNLKLEAVRLVEKTDDLIRDVAAYGDAAEQAAAEPALDGIPLVGDSVGLVGYPERGTAVVTGVEYDHPSDVCVSGPMLFGWYSSSSLRIVHRPEGEE